MKMLKIMLSKAADKDNSKSLDEIKPIGKSGDEPECRCPKCEHCGPMSDFMEELGNDEISESSASDAGLEEAMSAMLKK